MDSSSSFEERMIYFIFSVFNEDDDKISLGHNNSKNLGEIEKVQDFGNVIDVNGNKFQIRMYKIPIKNTSIEKDKFRLVIKKLKANKQLEKTAYSKDWTYFPQKNNFLYDSDFDEYNNMSTKFYKISSGNKFSFFLKYIKDTQSLKELREFLIDEALKIFSCSNEIEYSFFCKAFRESFGFKEAPHLLLSFDHKNKPIFLEKNDKGLVKFIPFNPEESLKEIIELGNDKGKEEDNREIIKEEIFKSIRLEQFSEEEIDRVLLEFNAFRLLFYLFYLKKDIMTFINNEKKYISIVYDCAKYFKDYRTFEKNDVQTFISFAKTKEELKNSLKLCKNYNDLFDLVEENKEKFNDNFQEEKLDINGLSKLCIGDDLEKFFKYYEQIRKGNTCIASNDIYSIIEACTTEIFKLPTLKSLDFLINIIKHFSKLEEDDEVKDHSLSLKNNLHKLGLSMAANGILRNEKLIEFIQEDDFLKKSKEKIEVNEGYFNWFKRQILNYYNSGDVPEEFIEIIAKGIFLDEGGKELAKKITRQTLDLQESAYPILIKKIFLSIEKFNTLESAIEIVENFDNTDEFKKMLIETFDRVVVRGRESYDEDKEKFKSVVNSYISKVIDYINISENEAKTFLEKFQDTLIEKTKIIDLYISILEFFGEFKALSKEILNYLIKNFSQGKDSKNLFSFINNIREDNTLVNVFESLREFCIKIEDFFSPDNSNFQLLIELIKYGYFDEGKKYRSSSYIILSKNVLQKIEDKLSNKDINYQEACYICKNAEEFSKRIKNIFLREEGKKDKRFSRKEIFQNSLRFVDIYDDLYKIVKYYELIEDVTKEKKFSEEQKEIKTVFTLKLNGLEQAESIYEKYKGELKKEKQQSLMLSSLFFKEIYRGLEGNATSEERMAKAIEHFNSLSNIFSKSKDSKEETWNLVMRTIKDEEHMKAELELLKEYFKVECNINEVSKELMWLICKRKNIQLLKGLKIFIDQLGPKKTKFSTELEDFLKKLSIEVSPKKIKNLITNSFKDLFLDETIEDSEFLTTVILFTSRDEVLPFLSGKKEDDVRNIENSMNEIDQPYLNPKDLDNFIQCIVFVSTLKSGAKDDHELIQNLKKLTKSQKFSSIKAAIGNVSENIFSIMDLYNEKVDANEFSKAIIEKIMRDSEVKFSRKERTGLIECNFIYDNITQPLEKVEYLNNRCVFKLTELSDKNTKYKCEELTRILIQFQKLKTCLNSLLLTGHLSNLICEYKIINSEIRNKEGNKIRIEDKVTELQTELENLRKEQIKYYKEDILMTFVFGKLFKIIFNFLTEEKAVRDISKENEIDNEFLKFQALRLQFLKYITLNRLQREIKHKYIIKGKKFENLTYNTSLYISNNFENNKVSKDDLFKSSRLITREYSGLYNYKTSSKLESEILSCYKMLTGNLPSPYTLLMCIKATTFEEISAFMYRYFTYEKLDSKGKNPALFMFVIFEALEDSVIQKLTNLLTNLKEETKEEKKNSVLIFFYPSNFVPSFTEIERHTKNFLFEVREMRNLDPNVEVVYSDLCGTGKTQYIKDLASREGKGYVFFPLGGDFKEEVIIDRLIKLKNESEVLFHLNLTDSNQAPILRRFLFSVLVLRIYTYNEKFFVFDKNTRIEVEVPYGFIDFFEVYPILKCFSAKLIGKNGLMNRLMVSKEVNSNVQVFANYLKYISEMNKKDAFIEGINSKSENKITFTPLSEEECRRIVNKHLKIKNPTFYQINSFINIIAEQFKLFTTNIYLSSSVLLSTYRNLKMRNPDEELRNFVEVRSFCLEGLVKVSQYFTKGAYDEIIKSQNDTFCTIGNYNIDSARESANSVLVIKESIQFDKINPTLLFINEDRQSISIITTVEKSTDEYKSFQILYNSQGLLDGMKELPEYRNLSHDELLLEIRKVFNLAKNKDISKLIKDYKFTSDNFIKIILILLRMRGNIPAIMMGETGCGKTSLINIVAKLKACSIFTLNIHAGITDNKIMKFLEKNDLIGETSHLSKKIKAMMETVEMLENMEELDKDLTENLKRMKRIIEKSKNKKCLVFLDEINTCNSLGLIEEMMCKGTALGKPIRPNVMFVGACNPYRMNKARIKFHGLLKESRRKKLNLVYSVNPLPHPLLNFVFDFGALKDEDEKKYIKAMISTPFAQIEEGREELEEKTKEAIFTAQEYIRSKGDFSSVSLREVRRFVIFFEFFLKYLEKKYELSPEKKKDKYLKAIILSVYICYFLRIDDKEQRNELGEKLKGIFDVDDFFEYPSEEQEFILSQIDIEKGISRNRILKENLFALFVCINTKVPIFICGKPGCSKTLCMRLLFKSMKGKNSQKIFFKKFPRLYMSSYQGSSLSTSKEIKQTFKKARDTVEKLSKKNEEMISLIFFDELGLAEISDNNPLKVMHSELEYDDNRVKVAFVGISNWSLDASKTNRGIFLSVPQPDEEDLKATALAIAESFDSNLETKYKSIIETLAYSYYKYKKELLGKKFNQEEPNQKGLTQEKLKQKELSNQEFHGTRDFYHLIQQWCRNAQSKDNNILDEYSKIVIAKESFERNFGGLEGSSKRIKEIFIEEYRKFPEAKNQEMTFVTDVKSCIDKNLEDPSSRYLLLKCISSESQNLVTLILNENKKNYIFLEGSLFEEDINGISYSIGALSKVQTQMDKGNIIVFRNFDMIYPSLYDLFNQNFTVIEGKNFARITIGSTTNNMLSSVDKNFKCIVLVDREKILDPPFLNRFEKQILSFEPLLGDLKETMEHVSKNIKELVTQKDEKEKDKINIVLNLKSQLVNAGKEQICSIIYHYKRKYPSKEGNEIKAHVFKKLAPTFSQDIIGFCGNSLLFSNNRSLIKNIKEYYARKPHSSLKRYLLKTKLEKHRYHLIYTFSSSATEIDFGKDAKFPWLDEVTKEDLNNKFISEIKSERELEIIIEEFLLSTKKILLLHFTENSFKHMNHTKYVIENYKKSSPDRGDVKKIILFIAHLNREVYKEKSKGDADSEKEKTNNFISHLSDYKHIFIDDLVAEEGPSLGLFNKENKDIFEIVDFKKMFSENCYDILSKIQYDFKNIKATVNIENYRNLLAEKILGSERVAEEFKKAIVRSLSKEKPLIFTVFTQKLLFKEKNDLTVIFKKYAYNVAVDFLAKVIFQLELNYALSIYVFSDFKNTKAVQEIWTKYVSEFNFNDSKLDSKSSIKFFMYFDVNIPLSINAFKNIISLSQEIKQKYVNEEYYLRNETGEGNIDKEKEKFQRTENELFDQLSIAINSSKGFRYLLPYIGEANFLEALINDYYAFYLTQVFKERKDSAEVKRLLEIIISLKFPSIKEDQNLVLRLAKVILFLDSAFEYVSKLCEISAGLSEFIPDYYEEIRKKVKEKNDEYDSENFSSDPENNSGLKYVNKPCVLVLDSIFELALSRIKLYETDDEMFYNFFRTLKKDTEIGLVLENTFSLFSNKIFVIKQLVMSFELFEQLGAEMVSKFKGYLNLLLEEEKSFKSEDFQNHARCLKDQVDLFEENFCNMEGYHEFVVNVLKLKFHQFPKEECRKEQVSIILKDNGLIKKIYKFLDPIIQTTIKDLEGSEPEEREYFLDFVENDEDEIMKLLNDSENPILHEMLINYFEKTMVKYLTAERILEDDRKVIGFLSESINYIIDYKLRGIKDPLGRIGFFYSVAYVKVFLKMHQFIVRNNATSEYKDNVPNTLMGGKLDNDRRLSSFRKTILLFMLKIFRANANTFEEFLEERWDEYQLDNIIEYFELRKEKNIIMIESLFLPLNSIKTYDTFAAELESAKKADNKSSIQIKSKKDLMIFNDAFYNCIIGSNPNLLLQTTKELLKKITNDLIENLRLEESKDFLTFHFSSILGQAQIKKEKKLPILLWSYKLCLAASLGKKDSFYHTFLNKEDNLLIKKRYPPGAEDSPNVYLRSYELIKEHFEKIKSPHYGIYMCSCGKFYDIPPCGFPVAIKQCNKCGKNIGGEYHVLVEREGHFRVFRDEKEKQYIESHPNYKPSAEAPENVKNNFKGMPSKTLAELKQEIDRKVKEEKGIGNVTDRFSNYSRTIRNFSPLAYRLASFTLYSIIHFKYLQWKDDDLKQYLNERKDFLFMLEENWNAINYLLRKESIVDINAYLNMIYPELSDCIMNCSPMNTPEARKEFEAKLNTLVEDSKAGFGDFLKKYNEKNNKILFPAPRSIRALLEEKFSPDEISSENEEDFPHPYLKYFMLTSYPSEENFLQEFQNRNLGSIYPITDSYFKMKDRIKMLSNLPLINPFANSMLERYSYKITREDAKRKELKQEYKNDEEMRGMYDNFKRGFNEMSKKSISDGTTEEVKYKSYSMEDYQIKDLDAKLSFALNDDGETSNGMYLAQAYSRFITYQNDFVAPLIKENSINTKTKLSYLKSQLQEKIPVQAATEFDIIKIKEERVTQILFSNSTKDCFNDDGSINYSKYKDIMYKYDEIEEALGYEILLGKRCFEESQEFVVYMYEGFSGERADIFNNFSKKIPQKKLEEQEKEQLDKFSKSNSTDFLSILKALQIIIFYLQKQNYQNEESIHTIIGLLPSFITIPEKLKQFFENYQNFSLSVIYDIYEYFECLSFDKIKEGILDDYKAKIPTSKVDKINEYFLKNDLIITKSVLALAVRKFISRYLTGERASLEFNKDQSALEYLQSRPELWDKSIFSDQKKLTEEFSSMREIFEINFKELFDFFNVLGGDSMYTKMNEQKKKEKEKKNQLSKLEIEKKKKVKTKKF